MLTLTNHNETWCMYIATLTLTLQRILSWHYLSHFCCWVFQIANLPVDINSKICLSLSNVCLVEYAVITDRSCSLSQSSVQGRVVVMRHVCDKSSRKCLCPTWTFLLVFQGILYSVSNKGKVCLIYKENCIRFCPSFIVFKLTNSSYLN